MLSGVTASAGVACGKILIFKCNGEPESQSGDVLSPEDEIRRLERAVKSAAQSLKKLRGDLRKKTGEREELIFEAQGLILEDPAFIGEAKKIILKGGISALDALKRTVADLEIQFLEIEDPAIRQRIADIKDVGARVSGFLRGGEAFYLPCDVNESVVLVMKEILPSQAAGIDREKIIGIATEKGGVNSHASIIARSLGIPFVAGVSGLLEKAQNSKNILIDGLSGRIYLDPSPDLVENFKKIQKEYEFEKESGKDEPLFGRVLTLDGEEARILANIGRMDELDGANLLGVDGIGVLRTEFMLFNRKTLPSSEELAENFIKILDFMSPRPVDIRLFDIGGDKVFPFLKHPDEANPALGLRGIRYLLENPEILETQLRGVLEAGRSGNVRILLPLVTNAREIRDFIKILRKIEMELSEEGVMIKTHIPVGIMIETPSVALLSENLAFGVDFFSIGTNDLTQYTLAADRESGLVRKIYNGFDPSVLMLVKSAIDGAKKSGIEVSVCGEMASSEKAIPLLLGLGARVFSVAAGDVRRVKGIIGKIDVQESESVAGKCLKYDDSGEVEKALAEFLDKTGENQNQQAC